MYKYYMNIDGDFYIGLFLDHIEAADFVEANREDDATVIVYGFEKVDGRDIVEDYDFEYSYRIEMAYLDLFPNGRKYSKVSEMEDALKRAGYL